MDDELNNPTECLDNLVGFSESCPPKLIKLWKENYQIRVKDLTSVFTEENQKEKKYLSKKELKDVIADIHKRRSNYFDIMN